MIQLTNGVFLVWKWIETAQKRKMSKYIRKINGEEKKYKL